MPYIFVLVLIALIACLYLALYVLRLNYKGKLNRILALFYLSLSLWAFATMMMDISPDAGQALFWLETAFIAYMLGPTLFLHFCLVLAKKNTWLTRPRLALLYLPAAGDTLYLLLGGWESNFTLLKSFYGWCYIIPVSSLPSLLYKIFFLAYLGAGLAVVYFWGKKASKKREQKQARIAMWLSSSAILITVLSELMHVSQGGQLLNAAPLILVMLWAGGLLWVIKKYRLMSSAPLQATDIIIDGIRDLLLMIDLRGTILLTNKRLQETLQYGEHNLLHYKFQNWLAEKNIIDEKIAAIRDHNIVTFQCMVHLIARDGRNIPVLLTGSVVKDSWDDVIGILLIGHDMTTLKQLQSEMLDRHSVEEALQDADYMLRSFADNFPGFILIKNQDSRIVMINKRMAAYYDFPQDHLVGMSTAELLPEAIAAQVMAREQQALQLEPGQALEVEEQLEWNGTLHSYSTSIFPIRRKNKITLVGSLSLDITDRKRAEQALRESEEKFRLLAETSVAAITIHRNGRFLYVNPKASELTGFSQSELLDMYIWEVFHPDFVETLHNIYRNFQPGMNLPSPLEAKTINREGKEIWNYIISCQIVLDGEPAVLSHFYDISDRKESEEQLQRLSMHDSITGLHNRTYFEEQMRRIEADQTAPVGIIICDVDGLKIVNDTLGHSTGDRLLVQAAHLIKKCFREDDIVARVGGDEFAVLLPHTPHKMVMNGYLRIRQAIVDYNSDNSDLLLKMSVGFAATDKPGAKMDALFREADNYMYREKLRNRKTTQNEIVQALMKALADRDFSSDGHIQRLQDILLEMGIAHGMTENSLANLCLLAQFHDIGKVGIPDFILFKPGPHTPEEKKEMNRHCEIGQRIAESSPDLSPVADWILKHHEWWNGNGYPLGLKGEAIPLECRMLAIADAYDVMTHERPYHKAISHARAIKELQKMAGIQFDPVLVEEFVQLVESGFTPG